MPESLSTDRPLSTTAPLPLPLHWHKSAPAELASAGDWSQPSPGWAAWVAHLGHRRRPRRLRGLLPRGGSPLLWALPEGDADEVREIVAGSGKKRSRRRRLAEELPLWLAEAGGAPRDPLHALACLAWCHALPALAAHTASETWWGALAHLLRLADETPGRDAAGNPLVWQLLAGELPLTLAWQFPELKNCRRLADLARETLSAGLAELLDGQGSPRCDDLPLLGPLLACWTRARAIGGQLKRGCWDQAADSQFPKLVWQAWRLRRGAGSPVFSTRPAAADDRALLAAAAALAGDRGLRRFARRKGPHRPKAAAAMHSEWAGLAVLRPTWRKSCPRLTVGYSQRRLSLELEAAREVVVSGPADPELRWNGQVLAPSSPWRAVRWVSDDDVDALELELEHSGVTLVRQVVLARADRFLLLADAVRASEPGRIELTARLPLSDGTAFEPAAETWEAGLTLGRARLRVLPLALPEWRSDPRGWGSLGLEAGAMCLRQSAEGAAMFAPLFVDLDARRRDKPLTWRRLTVVEDRVAQPADAAAGFRVQIGKRQWLLYHSLTGAAVRTVLGLHTASQCVVGRFTQAGEVEPLLQID